MSRVKEDKASSNQCSPRPRSGLPLCSGPSAGSLGSLACSLLSAKCGHEGTAVNNPAQALPSCARGHHRAAGGTREKAG